MRYLVGAACVAVVAAVAYFFMGQYQAHRARVAVAEGVEVARDELFTYAGAEPNDIVKVRNFCRLVSLSTDLSAEAKRSWLASCRREGFL